MVRDKNVCLIRIELFTADHANVHSCQAQPVTRAPVGPPIDPVLFLEQNSEQQHRRREQKQQHGGDKPRPGEQQHAKDVRPSSCARLRGAVRALRITFFRGTVMHRRSFAHRQMSLTSKPCQNESRDSGGIFIELDRRLELSSEARCNSSRFARTEASKTRRFYKYFAPTALAIVLAIASGGSVTARAQRRSSNAPIPSPRSILGFNPGDDRTIADWKQISDYFTRLDAASDRIHLQTIGTSTSGRAMFVAFISAPEN